MTVVLKTVAFGTSRREGENRIQPVQGLNGCFLIDAEYGRVLRRTQVQTEDVSRFRFELGIVTGHVSFEAMRLEAGFLPNPMHGVFLTPSTEASLRQLQCVEPSLGFLRVADKMRARKAGVRTLGFCPG